MQVHTNDQKMAHICADMLRPSRILIIYQGSVFASFILLNGLYSEITYTGLLVLFSALLLSILLVYLSIRLSLDYHVLLSFAQGRYSPDEFDQQLVFLHLMKKAQPRTMAMRCQGAMRYYRWLLTTTLVLSINLFILLITYRFGW